MSNLILAEKWELEVPIKGGNGAYKIDGQKTLKHEKKLIKKSWAEDRNKALNNEHYIFFPEETAELMKQRDENIKKNVEKTKKESIGMHDLVDAIVNKSAEEKVKTDKPEDTKNKQKGQEDVTDMNVDNPLYFSSLSLEQLQDYCDKNVIKYHHKAGRAKLIEITKAAQS